MTPLMPAVDAGSHLREAAFALLLRDQQPVTASPRLCSLISGSERWRAIGHGPGGATEEVEDADPVAALNPLVEWVRRR